MAYRWQMGKTFKRTHGAVECLYTFGDEQLRLKIIGALCTSSLRVVVKDLDRCAQQCNARSMTVDMRGVVLAVNYEELLRSPANLSPAVRNIPAGLLVPNGDVLTFREFAWEQAKHGVLRGVFEEPEQAGKWAEKQAEVRHYFQIQAPAR